MNAALHFVRFNRFDQRFSNAVAVFGKPDFLHRVWDLRARREIMDGDVIVFAKGESDQEVSQFNGDDEYYQECSSKQYDQAN